MGRNEGRRLSAEEKLRVVEEGRQSGATISEVCRRHQVDHAQFYRWERLARQGAVDTHGQGRGTLPLCSMSRVLGYLPMLVVYPAR
jgi:transposase